jgi:hypothetical protein
MGWVRAQEANSKPFVVLGDAASRPATRTVNPHKGMQPTRPEARMPTRTLLHRYIPTSTTSRAIRMEKRIHKIVM